MQVIIKTVITLAFFSILVLAAFPVPEVLEEPRPSLRPVLVVEVPSDGVLAIPAPGFPRLLVLVPFSVEPARHAPAPGRPVFCVRDETGQLRPIDVPPELEPLLLAWPVSISRQLG